MSITSLNFPFFVLGIAVIYYIIPKKLQWIWLLLVSSVFYLNLSKSLSIYLLITIVSVFVLGLFMEKWEGEYKERLSLLKKGEITGDKKALKEANKKRKRILIWICILINLGMLVFLKFYNLIVGEIHVTFGLSEGDFLPLLDLILPLGISFYTFQAIGYLVDVYRGKQKAEHNFFRFALFMCFFPQMIQGPISRYHQLAPQLEKEHTFDYEKFCRGFQLLGWGFFKKMVIADRAALLANQVFNNYTYYEGWEYIVALLVYAAQMYGDFSGGIDIIRGVAQVLDIDMVENFERPYFSVSIPEFWRRWHMTLGTWFRDYLFYPLSLSKYAQNISKFLRKRNCMKMAKVLPSYIVCIILWLANGAWHGAGIQFILFGIYHGILTILSMHFGPKTRELATKIGINMELPSFKVFQILRTFFLVEVGRIIYVAPDIGATWHMFKSIFTAKNMWILFDGGIFNLGLDSKDMQVLFLSCLVLFLVEFAQERGVKVRQWISEQNTWLRWTLWILLIFIIFLFGIYGKGYDSAGFIYMMY